MRIVLALLLITTAAACGCTDSSQAPQESPDGGIGDAAANDTTPPDANDPYPLCTHGDGAEILGVESPVVSLALGPDRLHFMASTDYGAGYNSVFYEVLLSGGSPQNIASIAGHGYGLAARDGFLYWMNSTSASTTSALRMPIAGGSPTILVDSGVEFLALADTGLVIARGGQFGLYPFAGGEPHVVCSYDCLFGAAVNSSTIVWSDARRILTCPLSGEPGAELASFDSYPMIDQVYADSTHAWWREGAGTNNLRRVPLTGGPAETVIAAERIGAVRIDSNQVFWAMHPEDMFGFGQVMVKTLGEDSPSTTVVGNQGRIGEIELDATHVYWTEETRDRVICVKRINRPLS